MPTTKRKRKYSQDFSGHSRTDTSFAAACDVNNIVRHYQTTGVDPFPDRLAEYQRQAANDETAEATTLTYADAMRNKAEADSYLAEHPISDAPASPPAEPAPKAPDVADVAKPPPEDASQAKTEA
nr:MAG: internal scaffolding protein [Microvirus sp.]